jgi:ABC-type sugar transport system permease subunit
MSHWSAGILGPVQPELAAAMLSEIEFIEHDWSALRWSLGCFSCACVERTRSRHPMLFRVGIIAPLALWRVGSMLIFGWLGLLSALGLVGKMLHPALVGLWLDLPLGAQHRYESASDGLFPVRVGHDHIVFGLPYNGTGAVEVLGSWFLVLMAALLFVSIWGGCRNFLGAMRALGSG